MSQRLHGEGLGYQAAGRRVIDGVSVLVEAGSPLAVTGPSGSGKTTLLLLLAGLLRPSRGRVLVDGGPPPAEAGRVGFVFQGHGLLPLLTAAENVALPLQAAGMARAVVAERTQAALSATGLWPFRDHLADQLSGGQRQRVAVARALAGDPPLLFADEPTSELDAEHRGLVVRLLRERADRGGVLVVSTHDPDVAAACDQELRLLDGRRVG